MAEIIIIGHKNPDTDSIITAIAYAILKNKIDNKNNYIAARCGEINNETKAVLKKASLNEPMLIENISGKKVILIDHNEFTQACDGIEKAEILEVIDHHKINFSYPLPIYFYAEPIGATSTIIAKIFFEKNIIIEKNIALALLAAILSDTVVFKSSTTTNEDREIAKKLAEIAEVKDIEAFGIEIKREKTSLLGKSIEEIILGDFKEYKFAKGKVGIGQIEIVDFKEVEELKKEIINGMEKIKNSENFDLVLLMATNILLGDTQLLCVGKIEKAEEAFNLKAKENCIYLKNVMSRKKDIVPKIEKVFS
jgi:manganese-dependent inorganic pyrophosphatase